MQFQILSPRAFNPTTSINNPNIFIHFTKTISQKKHNKIQKPSINQKRIFVLQTAPFEAMQRAASSPSSSCSAKHILNTFLKNKNQTLTNHRETPKQSVDVFINHRGIDTKKNVAGLLYDHLKRLGIRPFLDSKSMKPGDKLFEKIDMGIRQSRIGVAVFSPNYCKSYFCLHELALMMETKKRVVPIFCNVKPSELQVLDYGTCTAAELERFSRALEEAKYTVGLTFDTSTGDWPEFIESASEAVIQNLVELEEEEILSKIRHTA